MPAKGGRRDPPGEPGAPPRFRHPSAELVQRAAGRVVRGGKASFVSQAAFRRALLRAIRTEEPLAAIGGPRIRRLLIDYPGIRISVRYRERPNAPPPRDCPVCGAELTPIRNRTLAEETIVLGRRCPRCGYWTHANRRIPVRYSFGKSGIDGRPLP